MKQMGYQQGLDIRSMDVLEDFEESIYAEYEQRKHLRTHMHLHARKPLNTGVKNKRHRQGF
jgi:hypothetical protein